MSKKTAQPNATGYRKFGMRDSLAYAAGDFGCNMSFALKSTMVIFWTQYMQLPSVIYAALLLVVQIWDAINDPLIGAIVDADKHKYRRNKFLTYIFVGSCGLTVAGALCFLPFFKGASDVAKGLVFVCGYILWDAFYTIANVPYGSLLSLISEDPGDRASLSAWRSVGSLVGNLITVSVLPMLIYDDNNNLMGDRVFIIALIMGVAGFIAFQFMIRNTVIRVDTEVKVSEERQKFNVIKAIGNFVKNRPAVGATLAAMGMFLGMQGMASANTVLFQSYFKAVKFSGIISMFAMLPMILFTPLARKLVLKYGKKELSIVGSLLCCVSCLAMLLVQLTGNTNADLIFYVVCQLINYLGMGIYSTVSWSMMGDAIDYNEWKFGTREEGTVYALHSFFRKLAQGLGPSIVLVIMVALGYVEANEGNQVWKVALRMRTLVPAGYLFSGVMMLLGLGFVYNLDKKTLTQMTTELDERRKAAK